MKLIHWNTGLQPNPVELMVFDILSIEEVFEQLLKYGLIEVVNDVTTSVGISNENVLALANVMLTASTIYLTL